MANADLSRRVVAGDCCGFRRVRNPAAPDPRFAERRLSAATLPYVGVQVVGKPRIVGKHPNVLWDQDDIDHYKQMLRSSRESAGPVPSFKQRADELVGRPVVDSRTAKGPGRRNGSIRGTTFRNRPAGLRRPIR